MFLNAIRTPLRTSAIHLARRPLSTTTPRASNPLLKAHYASPKFTPAPLSLSPRLLVRGVASQVSGRPGSQTIGHAAQNIKEEVGNSAADLARAIAGRNDYTDAVKSNESTFLGITNAVAHSVPTPYVVFGLAGGLPYIGAAATTIYLARQAGEAATGVLTNIDPGVAITVLHQALDVQVTYGAVMLSFLGALHWGFEFAGYGGAKGYPRLFLGAAPVVFGWSTLLLDPMNALIMQWAGFTGLWYADLKATGSGWAPKWYSQYRFYLSILVGTCIIGSLGATSYWGPVGGHGFVSHDLDMIRGERMKTHPDQEGVVAGNIQALPAGEEADNYVMIKKKETEESKKEGKKEDN